MFSNILLMASITPLVVSHKHGHSQTETFSHDDQHFLGTVIHFSQEFLFPFNAKYNSFLATIIVQAIPFIIIFSTPAVTALCNSKKIDGSMNLLVSFGMGTLLGDIFLHLLPEVFESIETKDEELAHKQFITMGAATFAGFMIFLVLEKTLKIMFLGTNQEVSLSSHSHSHSHSPDTTNEKEHTHIHTSGHNMTEKEPSLRQRRKGAIIENDSVSPKALPESVVSAYLNVATGLIHNITDGVTLASSFYSSKHVGVTTALALMFHEIPHKLGDLAILTSSGLNFKQALNSLVINSIGALTGTAIGCALNEMSSREVHWYQRFNEHHHSESSLLTFMLSNLRLPLTTGGFLYLVTMGVVPQILATSTKKPAQEFKIWSLQLMSISIGFILMAFLAFME